MCFVRPGSERAPGASHRHWGFYAHAAASLQNCERLQTRGESRVTSRTAQLEHTRAHVAKSRVLAP